MEEELQILISNKKVPEVSAILEEHPDDLEINWRNQWGRTCILYACNIDSVECLALLLAYPGIDVNLSDNYRGTPLHEACAQNAIECVKLMLLDPRVDVKAYCSAGFTAAYIAVVMGHMEIIKWWIVSGRELEVSGPRDFHTFRNLRENAGKLETWELVARFNKDPEGTRNQLRQELDPHDDLSEIGKRLQNCGIEK
jgi:hypothetical protein